ncbi:hypothetical protein LMIY3S_05804 [Labrys miyagiensis]
MTREKPVDQTMGVVAITFEDEGKDEEDHENDVVGLDITLPLPAAEEWAAEHERDLKDAEITVQPIDGTPAPPETSDHKPS